MLFSIKTSLIWGKINFSLNYYFTKFDKKTREVPIPSLPFWVLRNLLSKFKLSRNFCNCVKLVCVLAKLAKIIIYLPNLPVTRKKISPYLPNLHWWTDILPKTAFWQNAESLITSFCRFFFTKRRFSTKC